MNEILPPVVRYATTADYPQIIAMSEALHEENGHQAINYEVAEAAIMSAINRNRAVIGIIGPVGGIEGIVFLRFASFWYSDDVFLEELFLYVGPAYRKTGNAKALLTFARDAAKKLKLPLVIGVLSNHRTKAKLKLYEKHLGAPVGGYFFVEG
jgi:GNAT superfamily N-acetyltransferase